MTYREIAKLDWFCELNASSLGTLYQRSRKRGLFLNETKK